MAMNQTVGVAGPELALGQRLQKARQAAGLTQQALCQQANLSYSTLAKIERGAIKSPSIFTIQSIAAALHTSLDELVGTLPGQTPVGVAEKGRSKSGIRFVYFDVNGCLVRFFQQAFSKVAEDTGANADIVETAFWHFNDEACRGQMTVAEFNQALAQRLGVAELDWSKYYLAAAQPMPGMAELISWVAEHYKLGLLTNIMPGLLETMQSRQMIPPVTYDAIINSSVVGVVKPDPAIYDIAAAQAGVSDSEILFVDDSRANLIAAEKRGWRVLWFDDYNPEASIKHIRQALELA